MRAHCTYTQTGEGQVRSYSNLVTALYSIAVKLAELLSVKLLRAS